MRGGTIGILQYFLNPKPVYRVYKIIDSNNNLKYIGCTHRVLSARYSMHLAQAQSKIS